MTWRDELRSNPRLRLGLAMVASVLGLYGLLEWHDHQSALSLDLQRLSQQVQQLSSVPVVDPWPARLREARDALQIAEQRLWLNSSTGLAQAQFQDWLREQLRRVNVQNASVRIAEFDAPGAATGRLAAAPPEPLARSPVGSDLLRVGAQLEFALPDPQLLVAVLAGMAAAERTVVVESLVVKAQRVDMRVAAWFRISAVPKAAS